MSCTKIKRLLSDYVAHVTAPEETQRVRAHVRDCADCAAALDELQRIVRAASAQRERTVLRDCWPAVRERLMAADLVARGVAIRRRWATILTGAVAAAAIATAVVLRVPERPAPGPTPAGARAKPVALQTGVEREYLQAYAAFRDARPLASGDGVVIMGAGARNGD
jgi:hypothetical protein